MTRTRFLPAHRLCAVALAALLLGGPQAQAQIALTPEELLAVARGAAATGQPAAVARAGLILDRIEAEHPASDIAALILLYRTSGMTDDAVIAAIDARMAGAAPAAPAIAAIPAAPAIPGAPATLPSVPPVAALPVVPPAAAPPIPAPPIPAPPVPAALPPAFERDERALLLSRGERQEIQGRLAAMGYPVGSPDGAFGARTRSAIAEWQAGRGVAPTGYLNAPQIDALAEESSERYAGWLASRPPARSGTTTQRPRQPEQRFLGMRTVPGPDPCAGRNRYDQGGSIKPECLRRR